MKRLWNLEITEITARKDYQIMTLCHEKMATFTELTVDIHVF